MIEIVVWTRAQQIHPDVGDPLRFSSLENTESRQVLCEMERTQGGDDVLTRKSTGQER
jgi:hypothetical protein